jgi:CRISPR/Cas system-associated exonuclease Cas4 (RecB family)
MSVQENFGDICKAQIAAYNNHTLEERTMIGASELPYCLRKAYYRRLLKAPVEWNSYMLQGSIWHKALQDWFPEFLKQFGWDQFKILYEAPATFSDLIECHADVLTVAGVIKHVFEYKTTRDRRTEPKTAYICQANLTAVLHHAQGFTVLVQNVDDLSNFSDTDFWVSKDLANWAIERAYIIKDCLERQEAPKGPQWDWECRYCQFNQGCESDRRELETTI